MNNLLRRDLDTIRTLVRKEIERALVAQQPATKRPRIPCGTGNGNWPRCMGSAAMNRCTCGERMDRLVRDAALWIAWGVARGADDGRAREIADEIGSALGIRSTP